MNMWALVAYRAGSDIAGKGAFFLVTLLAARRLSQEEFGLFSLATTVGWMAAVATDAGIQLHLARAVAQRPSFAATLLRTWLRVRVWTASAAVLVVAAALAIGGARRPFAAAVLLFTVVYIVSGLVEFLHYFYRGLARSDVESTLTLAQRAVMLALALAVLWWQPGVAMLAVAMLIPAAGTLFYSLRRAHILSRAFERDENAGVSPEVRTTFLRTVLPIGGGIVLSALYFRVDVLLIETWNGAASVALYNAVFRLVEALRLFPAAVMAVALPALCRAGSAKPLLRVSAIVTVPATGIAAVLWAASAWLVPALYGNTYAAAVPAFQILLLSFPLMSLNYALTHQIIGWHGHRAYAIVCGAALVFNVLLNVRLLPALGIDGAAWATLWTEAVVTIGCMTALGSGRSVRSLAPVSVGHS